MAQSSIRRAKLKMLEPKTPDDELVFALNPSRVERTLAPVYAEAHIAGADYSPTALAGNPPPFQWVSNRVEEIHLEALFMPLFDLGETQNIAASQNPVFGAIEFDIEKDLLTLDRFCWKDNRTNEPPDLVFVFGDRIDRVRIWSKSVQETLWTSQLKCRRATVRLTLRAIRPRTS